MKNLRKIRSGYFSVRVKMAAAVGAAWMAFVAAPPALAADVYPARAITVLVPQAVGGSQDTLAREIALGLGRIFKESVVVDNRPGANGIIGTDLVARAAPDGYTLLIGGTGTMAINQSLYANVPYDPIKSFAPVAMIGYSTSVLVVNPQTPYHSLREIIADAKAHPGKIRYASAGIGSSPHLTAEMFKWITGTDIMHVPYKGSTPGVMATISGEIDMMFTGVASAIGQIKGGRLRAISITGNKRSPALPDVPSSTEAGLPGFEADFWVGLFAPAGTPPDVIQKLNQAVNQIVESKDMQDKSQTHGVRPLSGPPNVLGDILQQDIARWAKVVKNAGLKGE